MHPFEKLMMKKRKEGKVLSDSEKQAKGSVLDNLMSEMDSHDGEKLKGVKKVTVAAPSKEGLKEGLKKASDIVEETPELEESEESEKLPEEVAEHDEISQLKEEIRQLKEMLLNK